MYIITEQDIINYSTKITAVFMHEIDAINHLHSTVSNLSPKEGSYDILIVDPNRIEIYHRLNGWIVNSKQLITVFQLLHHKEQSCVCVSCSIEAVT